MKTNIKHGRKRHYYGMGMFYLVEHCTNDLDLVRIQGIMKKDDYLNILHTNLSDIFDESTYQAEEAEAHAKIVKKRLQTFGTIKRPAQSPNLNRIENLLAIIYGLLL